MDSVVYRQMFEGRGALLPSEEAMMKAILVPPAQNIGEVNIEGEWLSYERGGYDIIIEFPGDLVYIRLIWLEGHSGGGLTKEIFRKLIPFSRKVMNLNKMGLYAVSVGRYAWARYGFTTARKSRWYLEQLKEKLHLLLLGVKPEVLRYKHLAEIAVTRIANVPAYIENFALLGRAKDGAFKRLRFHKFYDRVYWSGDGMFLLGKYLLLNGEPWYGLLDFGYRMSMDIAKSYIGLNEDVDSEEDFAFYRIMQGVSPVAAEPVEMEVNDSRIKEEVVRRLQAMRLDECWWG